MRTVVAAPPIKSAIDAQASPHFWPGRQ